jgi:hypothetical protein
VIVVVAATAAASTPTPRPPTIPPAPTCATGTATLFNTNWYCPGVIIGLKKNTYGMGTRIVLRGVNVTSVVGTTVIIEGGPSCLQDPTKPPVFCGQTVPNVTVSFAGSRTVPHYGDVITLYGVTNGFSLTPTGYVVTGLNDPSFS